MYNQLIINTGTMQNRVFFKSKIPTFNNTTSPLHDHFYTEVHFLAEGKMSFDVCGKVYNLAMGDILAIPSRTHHLCTSTDKDNLYIGFFTDAVLSETTLFKVQPQLITSFIEEYISSLESGNYSKVAAYIALLCSDIFQNETVTVNETDDYAIVIDEFFSRRYAEDIRLCDLAAELHLSEKQTQRLVLKHTGQTFKQRLSNTRIERAKILIESANMPMQKAAEYVGYKSYSGFWKAFNQK